METQAQPDAMMVSDGRSFPLVSVVMPVMNEASFLDAGLRAIQQQTYPADRLEIFIVDGGSTDETVGCAQASGRKDKRIVVISKGRLNCPEAMNAGIKQARGKYVAKVDGHGQVNQRFIETAVASMEANQGIQCVGGRIIPLAQTPAEKANSIARFSPFGVGSGVYTLEPKAQFVDTVQCGVYQRDALVRAGAFDPNLQFGEDEEVNYRIIAQGGKILYHPEMAFHYCMRPSVKALFRQYHGYGMARVKVLRKFPGFFRVKHIVPSAVVLSVILSPCLLLLPDGWGMLAGVAPGFYFCFIVIGAIYLAVRNRFPACHRIGASLTALHFGYGSGFLRGVWDVFIRRR
jgi:glycosyltransferase involved in cell wall biosynthesis